MSSSPKTNRMALWSLILGLVIVLSIGIYAIIFPLAYPAGAGGDGQVNTTLQTVLDLTVSLRNFCALAALITGVLGLSQIKKGAGTEKGSLLAWSGIILGSGWIMFRLLVGLAFLLGEALP